MAAYAKFVLGLPDMDRTLVVSLCTVGFLARFSYALARNPVLPLFALFLGAGPEAIGLMGGMLLIALLVFLYVLRVE